MSLYARLREVLGMEPQEDNGKRSTDHRSEEDVFLIRHYNPDGTISYEPTEELMEEAALAASRVPPPDFSKNVAQTHGATS